MSPPWCIPWCRKEEGEARMVRSNIFYHLVVCVEVYLSFWQKVVFGCLGALVVDELYVHGVLPACIVTFWAWGLG